MAICSVFLEAATAAKKAEEEAAAAKKKAEEGMWTVHDDAFHSTCYLIGGVMFCVFRSCYCRKESGGGSCCHKEEGRGRYVDRAQRCISLHLSSHKWRYFFFCF